MSARECLVCKMCGSDVCPQCGKSHMAERIVGTDIEPGRVHPSVEGEIVLLVSGRDLVGFLPVGMIEKTRPTDDYRVIIQPV